MTALLEAPPLAAPVYHLTDHDTATAVDYGCREFSKEHQDQLILSYQPTVRMRGWKVLQTLPPHTVSLEELISVGNAGLVQAARAFPAYCQAHDYDPHAQGGGYAKAYVGRRVQGAILDHLRSLDHASRSARARYKAMQAGSTPEELGISRETADYARAQCVNRPVSLDATTALNEDGTALEERAGLADPEPSPESQVFVQEVLSAAEKAFAGLSWEGRVVVSLIYVRGLSVDEAADAMCTTAKHAEAIHDESVIAIHRSMLLASMTEESRLQPSKSDCGCKKRCKCSASSY